LLPATKYMESSILHSEEKSNLLQLYSTKMQMKEKFRVQVTLKNAEVTSMAYMTLKENVYGLPSGACSIICLTCTDSQIHVYA